MLKELAGLDKAEASTVDIEDKVRKEVVGKIAQGLMQLAGGNGSAILELATQELPTTPVPAASGATTSNGEYMAPWIESESCTACDECTKLNSKIFAYNNNKKAFIQNPNGGPYQDLVKAAEKCTARVIHPGLPADRSEKDIDKWIKRGEKFN